uniref:Radical SAM protein n=1 Tax=candidate division WOR-3 bacterium TaxID=2052148 RepID=A0A7C4UD35_UNCW3
MTVSDLKTFIGRTVLSTSTQIVSNDFLRKNLLKQLEYTMYRDLIKKNPDGRPLKVQEDKYYAGKALLNSIDRAIGKGNLSKNAIRGLLNVFLGNVFYQGFYERRKYAQKYGKTPPLFFTISPTRMCNLKCIGCYAGSEGVYTERLPFNIFDEVLNQAKRLWGARFFVISGGEPLLYKDDGKGLFDIFKKHNDCYFLMYTNGTLIDKENAKELAYLGNVTPAISVEGMKEETDTRRGKGVFEKIIKAFENLRNEGVPFGISITATRQNVNTIISDNFFNFYFNEQGAIYGWVFQYMPIGRGYTCDLMITPEERLKLFEWAWRMVKEEGIFIMDFWNSANASDGCISGARSGGYFYINWNGDVMPCVFIPYSVDNVIERFKEGKDLNDIINSQFFKDIREWQDEYAYKRKPEEHGNWLMPCFIRDHHDVFLKIVKKNNAKPIDEDAKIALTDDDYHKKLIEYDKRMEELTKPIWENVYLSPERRRE